jgi:16S rRNA (adenine1518-N6/adenine1519-N6)-dimethyltransferase
MLSVWAQLPYSGRRVKAVGPSCFWPRPEVGSTIVKLELRSGPLGPPADLAACRDLARLAFTQRRKQLGVILRRAAGAGTEDRAIASALAAAGLEARARPEDVTPGQWLALARRISLPRV